MKNSTTISSLDEYINFILSYRDQYKEIIWYRGQKRSDWVLDPSLYRGMEKYIVENNKEHLGTSDYSKMGTIRYRLKYNFNKEIQQFVNLMRQENLDKKEFNYFHYMFLGQHYGLKTPTLDWTTDPLVALFFAVEHFDKNRDKDVNPVVFILRPEHVGKRGIINVDNSNNRMFHKDLLGNDYRVEDGLPVPLTSNLYISDRIARQSGNFTLQGSYAHRNYPWVMSECDDGYLGHRIDIDAKCSSKILEDLDKLNINHASLYRSDPHELEQKISKIVKRANNNNP